MENIHILPTDKPSRIFITKKEGLGFDNQMLENIELDCQNQNLYITSDEEIKEGDWCYNPKSKETIQAFKKYPFIFIDCKKIILTTDQDLIKDNVQAIPDKFLEWFVKNPNCEFVETLFHYPTICDEGDYSLNLGYWTIIIPKEEHKQETVEEAAEKWVFETNSHKWSNNDNSAGDNYGSFLNGAKWQAERMYSEEEVKEILFHRETHYIKTAHHLHINEWFEQFKKLKENIEAVKNTIEKESKKFL